MSNLVRNLGRAHFALVKDRSGATAIEYGLFAAGISIAIIATVFLLSDELQSAFDTVLSQNTGAGAE